MTTIQEAFKELRLEELKQKRAVNEAKQKEEKKKIQEGLLSNFVPDPSEIPEVSTVKNAVSRRGKSLAQLGEEAEAKEKVCPECGKEVCECDKQINEDNEWENLHINSAVHKIKFCIDYYKDLQQHSPILRHEYQTRSKIHLNRLNDLFKYLEEEANDILKLKFAEKTYHAIKQKFYSDIQAADEKGDDSLKYSAINNAYLEAYEGLNDIFRHIISSKDPLDEEIEDEVNNGEIYSPYDVTDEEIDDMLDWMLHNGHYGKYTYNLDTVEGYQRLVSDAALNMISDEGIEPKSALARDLRGTSEFKEWEKAVTERLKAVYGIDPHDFDADLVEDIDDEVGAPVGDIASQYKSSPVRDALKPDTQARELTQAQLNSRFTQGDLNSARDHKQTVVNNSPEYEVRKLFNRYPIDSMLRRSQLNWDDIDGIVNYYISTTSDGPYLTDEQIAYLKARLPQAIEDYKHPKYSKKTLLRMYGSEKNIPDKYKKTEALTEDDQEVSTQLPEFTAVDFTKQDITRFINRFKKDSNSGKAESILREWAELMAKAINEDTSLRDKIIARLDKFKNSVTSANRKGRIMEAAFNYMPRNCYEKLEEAANLLDMSKSSYTGEASWGGYLGHKEESMSPVEALKTELFDFIVRTAL